jgi:hypothetical protein
MCHSVNPSWEENRCSANQEICHLLWNPKVHYHVHKSMPLISILNQRNPIHILHFKIVFQTMPSLPVGLYCLTLTSFSSMRLNPSISNFHVAHSLTDNFSMTSAYFRYWSVSQSAPLCNQTLNVQWIPFKGFPRDQKLLKILGFEMFTKLFTCFAENWQNKHIFTLDKHLKYT